MTFCSSCGAQLEGDGGFCVKCGADQKAKAGSAPIAVAAPPQAAYAPQPPAMPPPPVQPFAGMPPQYPPPNAPIPVIMGVPPGAQPANKNTLLYVIIGAAVLFGGYYYNQQHQQNPDTAPAPQTQPGQQPGGQGNPNQAIIAAQKFTEGGYNAVNGQIQVTQGQWLNGSNVPLQAAMLGCEQMDANGQNLTQDQVTLTGPAPPGATVTLPTFSIGAEAQGVTKVKCAITNVEAEN